MTGMRLSVLLILTFSLCLGALSCGDDDDGTVADQLYIGGICDNDDQCNDDFDETPELECLQDFKGGYCGLEECDSSDECPDGSLCAELEGQTYCFLVCIDKIECNINRTVENESNCSSNIDSIEGGGEKLCIPPSAGS